jgi:chorismate synthase
MNTFGRIFKISIFGESHGAAVGITVDGCPPGIDLSIEDFKTDLLRRQGGKIGTTPRKEKDVPTIISGVFNEKTTGSPITIFFENANVKSNDYLAIRDIPRPGHADFVLYEKFNGFNDFRGGGHSSGRLTVSLVAAGTIAKKILNNISISASILEIGGIKDIDKALDLAYKKGDSIGGIIECKVRGLEIGLGEPFFDSIESMISHAVFSIPAVKGIEFGSGFLASKMTGSVHNDPIIDKSGKTLSNHAGGINGGITNGNELVFRIAVKPTSSTPSMQSSWNKENDQITEFRIDGRHDLCIALRVPVVLEAVTAIVLADFLLKNK